MSDSRKEVIAHRKAWKLTICTYRTISNCNENKETIHTLLSAPKGIQQIEFVRFDKGQRRLFVVPKHCATNGPGALKFRKQFLTTTTHSNCESQRRSTKCRPFLKFLLPREGEGQTNETVACCTSDCPYLNQY